MVDRWHMPRAGVLLGAPVLAGLLVAALSLVALSAAPAAAATCTKEEFAAAVDRVGASLRKLNAQQAPAVQARVRELGAKKGWPKDQIEERAYEALQDDRTAAFDRQSNELLTRMDELGTLPPNGTPDCSKLDDLTAASVELQATVKAKSAYMLAKLDRMLGKGETPGAQAPGAQAPSAQTPGAQASLPPPAARPAPKPAPPPQAAVPPPPPPVPASPPQVRRETLPPAQGERPEPGPGPSQRADIDRPPPPLSAQPPSLPPGALMAPEDDGYTIDEIRAASAGFFGKLSANLGSVIEYAFHKAGRPTAYILGKEGGGAFLAGLRYGSGTLYMRAGGRQEIFWHGPSVGYDIGGEGSKILILIYRMHNPERLYAPFTVVDGSAYVVGGVGATLVTNGSIVMAPIRTGIGLRFGANVGYIRFTSRPTWNPF